MKKVVIDTDILLHHLTRPATERKPGGPSLLRKAMSEYFCYTTVFNAIELFSMCETRKERSAVEDVLYAMKVLGLNGKSAKNVGEFFRQAHRKTLRDMEALVAGVCRESRLPLLTASPRRYRGVRSLTLLTPDDLQHAHKKGT